MSRKIGITGFYGAGNLGDEAILTSLLAHLRSRGDFSFAVFGVNPEQVTATHGVPAYRFSLRRPWRDLRALWGLDAMVIGGGGLLHDYWPGVPARYLAWARCCRLAGVPLYLHAVGVGPWHRRDTAGRYRALFRLASDITVRDRGSLELATQAGGKARLCPDPALGLEPPPADSLPTTLSPLGLRPGGYALIAPRAWFESGPQAVQREGSMSATAALLAEVADVLQAEGLRPVFLRMHAGRDEHICRLVQGAMRNPEGTLILDPGTVPDCLRLVAGAALVVAMRLHALLLACLCAVPAVPLAYDAKVSEGMEACGQGWLSLTRATTEAVLGLAKQAAEPSARAAVAAQVAALRERLQTEYDALAGVLAGG